MYFKVDTFSTTYDTAAALELPQTCKKEKACPVLSFCTVVRAAMDL